MTEILELCNEKFKAAIIKMILQANINILETNGKKKENLNKEIEE